MQKTFIIVDVGANHNKDLGLAQKHIETAARCGVNAVKFQTYSSETMYSKNTPSFAGYNNIAKLIKSVELPRFWHKTLQKYCVECGVEFLSTPFDEAAVDELYGIGVKRFKIAGFEATDKRFVQYVAQTKLPLIITVGIGCNNDMIGDIIDWVCEIDSSIDLTILLGNNAYPTPIRDVNLNRFDYLKFLSKTQKNISIGLSDHTEGILVPPIAVARGAKCVEKHFTLNRRLPGPDHCFAVEPQDLIQMVENIRKAELLDGFDDKPSGFTLSERKYFHAMRSVVCKKQIVAGEMFTVDNITTKRPAIEDGILAKEYYNIIGKIAKRNIRSDEILLKSDF